MNNKHRCKMIQEDHIKVIAEIAQSYEGRLNILLDLIGKLSHTGVDGIMFQVIYADELALPENGNYKFFKSLEFSRDAWRQVVEAVHSGHKMAVAEVFGIESATMLFELGIDAIKIHSADLANIPYLKAAGAFGIPVILGVGAATEDEIEIALKSLRTKGNPEIVLTHGYQLCPTPIGETHLSKIKALTARFQLPVGYSDHIAGSLDGDISRKGAFTDLLPLLSISCGAVLIEKHVMPDRSRKWEDFESAITPEELDNLIGLISLAEKAYGTVDVSWNESESKYRLTSRKFIITNKDLRAGHVVQEGDFTYKRIAVPAYGIVNSHEVIGKKLRVNLEKDKPILKDDIGG